MPIDYSRLRNLTAREVIRALGREVYQDARQGFRDRDLRKLLEPHLEEDLTSKRKASARISRLLCKLSDLWETSSIMAGAADGDEPRAERAPVALKFGS